jgi:hypothetical protein
VWHSKKSLIEFGTKYCLLSKNRAVNLYEECFEAKERIKIDIENYISKNPHFSKIGGRMLDILDLDNQKTIKGLNSELIGAWRED